MSPSVRCSDWQVEGGGHEYRLVRKYYASDPHSPNTTATVRISCTLESSSDMNWINSKLQFCFKPFRLSQRTNIVVGLFTAEPKGGLVEVEAFPVPEELRNEMLDVGMNVHRDDVQKCLRALSSGNEMIFVLASAVEPEREPYLSDPPDFLVRLSLPNDQAFQLLYIETYERIATAQDATRARQLSEGWYRRRI